jgi:hypothetical protein
MHERLGIGAGLSPRSRGGLVLVDQIEDVGRGIGIAGPENLHTQTCAEEEDVDARILESVGHGAQAFAVETKSRPLSDAD